MSAIGKAEAEIIDAEIARRTALIAQLPEEIKERIETLRLRPGEIEIKIAQRDGLFVDVKRKS